MKPQKKLYTISPKVSNNLRNLRNYQKPSVNIKKTEYSNMGSLKIFPENVCGICMPKEFLLFAEIKMPSQLGAANHV